MNARLTPPSGAGRPGPAARNLAEWFRQVDRLLRSARTLGVDAGAVEVLRDQLVEDFASLLEYHAPLVLRVSPLEIWLRDELVVRAPETTGALEEPIERRVPFLLFRDGVRGLTFARDAAREDVRTLLDALILAAGAPDSNEDVVSLLWRVDLTGLRVEIAPIEECLPGDQAAQAASEAQTYRPATGHDAEAEPWAIPGTPTDVPAAWDVLLRDETAARAAWHEAWGAQSAQCWPERVETLVRAALAEHDTPATRAALGAAVVGWLAAASQRCDWTEGAQAWECLRRIDPEQHSCGPRIAAALGALDADTIADRLDDADRDAQARFFTLAVRIGAPALDLVVRVLARSARQRVRAAGTTALGYACANAPRLLAPYLRDTRWHVARNIVCALGQIGGEEAGELLALALRHPDTRVRRAAVTALGQVPVHRRTPLLTALLDTRDPAELGAVLEMLARATDPNATAAIVERVTAPDFETRPPEFRLALITVLGELADERAVPALEQLLHAGSWFARRSPERQAAAVALAAIGTPRALDLLQAGLRARAEAVRAACEAALEPRERSA